MVSRVPQIVQNYTTKSTGQLSIITYGLNLLGTLARIFTTMQEKKAGAAMMRGVIMCTSVFHPLYCDANSHRYYNILCFPCAAAGMNAIMVGQILAYGNQKPGITQKNKKNA
jgi:hypothetical protein